MLEACRAEERWIPKTLSLLLMLMLMLMPT